MPDSSSPGIDILDEGTLGQEDCARPADPNREDWEDAVILRTGSSKSSSFSIKNRDQSAIDGKKRAKDAKDVSKDASSRFNLRTTIH